MFSPRLPSLIQISDINPHPKKDITAGPSTAKRVRITKARDDVPVTVAKPPDPKGKTTKTTAKKTTPETVTLPAAFAHFGITSLKSLGSGSVNQSLPGPNKKNTSKKRKARPDNSESAEDRDDPPPGLTPVRGITAGQTVDADDGSGGNDSTGESDTPNVPTKRRKPARPCPVKKPLPPHRPRQRAPINVDTSGSDKGEASDTHTADRSEPERTSKTAATKDLDGVFEPSEERHVSGKTISGRVCKICTYVLTPFPHVVRVTYL